MKLLTLVCLSFIFPFCCSLNKHAQRRRCILPKRTRTSLKHLTRIRGGESEARNLLLESKKQQQQVSKFPILKSEWKRFLCMSGMMFLFIYIYTTVRDTKDSLIVTKCGAESLPFLKLYGVTPSAALFLIAYSKLSNSLSKSMLFYVSMGPFVIFYVLFAFVLYPMRDQIHILFPSTTLLEGNVRASGLSLLRYWSFSLYYIVSELWASVGVPIFFWQSANDVTSINQAKRFYPLFAVLGNLAPITSGKVMSKVVSLQKGNDDVGFGQTLKILATIKLFAFIGIFWIYRSIFHDSCKSSKEKKPQKPSPQKPSLKESIQELSQNKEVTFIAAMVLSYNMCVELSEVLWKGILNQRFLNKSEYMSFMAQFSQIVGLCAICLQLCSSEILRRFGWKYTSLITPISMAFFSIFFFTTLTVFKQKTHLHFIFGTILLVISKITKYSLFDPCKEIAFIPLKPEAKIKGKAAVDILGSRLGRNLANASQQVLVIIMGGTILKCAPALAVLYFIAVILWSKSVISLGGMIQKYENEN